MIAADQLVGREVSFSKSGFQFPKGAYRVPMEYNPSSENLPRARATYPPFWPRDFTKIREIFVLNNSLSLYDLYDLVKIVSCHLLSYSTSFFFFFKYWVG